MTDEKLKSNTLCGGASPQSVAEIVVLVLHVRKGSKIPMTGGKRTVNQSFAPTKTICWSSHQAMDKRETFPPVVSILDDGMQRGILSPTQPPPQHLTNMVMAFGRCNLIG